MHAQEGSGMNQAHQLPVLNEMDRVDWLNFAGAQGWDDGAQPLICEEQLVDGTYCVLVLDLTGGCLLLDDEQMEFGGYQLLHDFSSQAEARAWFYATITSLDKPTLLGAGFEAV
jgi:hypothetical protein